MKKTVFVIALVLVTVFVAQVFAVSNETDDIGIDEATHICTKDETIELIKKYFAAYYGSVEDLSVREELYDYIDDNEYTHLYIKHVEYAIECAVELGLTKTDVTVSNVNIYNYVVKNDGTVETVAYIVVNCKEAGDSSYTSFGGLWYISISNEKTPRIVSLYSDASEFHVIKKLTRENKEKNTDNKEYTVIDAINDACEKIKSDVAVLKELQDNTGNFDDDFDVDDALENEESNNRSVSVQYNRTRARQFANMKGFDEDTLIFKRMNGNADHGDCTNFISLCLWVGYAGDHGKDWYIQSDVYDCQQYAL